MHQLLALKTCDNSQAMTIHINSRLLLPYTLHLQEIRLTYRAKTRFTASDSLISKSETYDNQLMIRC